MPGGLWHAAEGVRNGQDSTHRVGSSFQRSPPRILNLGGAAAGTRWRARVGDLGRSAQQEGNARKEGGLGNGRILWRDDQTSVAQQSEFARRNRGRRKSAIPERRAFLRGDNSPQSERKSELRSEVKFGSGERWNSGSELSKGVVAIGRPEEEGMGVNFE